MSSKQVILLTEMKEQLKQINEGLSDLKKTLSKDREMYWKILALTIIGAFALIGIKLVI